MYRALLLLAVLPLGIHYSGRACAQSSQSTAQPQLNTESRSQSEPDEGFKTPSNERIGTARKLYQQGLALVEARQLAPASENFKQALQFDPDFAEAYAALGRTYFKMREWQKASDNLKRAAALKSKQQDATIQVKTVQPDNATGKVPSMTVSNRYSLTRRNPEIVASNEPSAATLRLRDLLPLVSEPANEAKTEATPLQSSTTEERINTATQIEMKPAQPLTVGGEARPVSKESDEPQIEQTSQGARVSQPVTPPANATGSAEVLPIARNEETDLTKIYRVGSNDVLDVRLNNGTEQQSTLYTVNAAGLLEHPLLNEPMSVVGLTVEEIGSRIEADLRRRAIVEDPTAVIGVRDYASHSVLVSGLVKESGTKFLRREAIPLYVVVADAQPLPEAAKVTVVRAGDQNPIHEVDLNQVSDMNFLVRSGDVITLLPHATQFVYIGGEIKLPGEKIFRRGLTLMQVILASGGLNPKAKFAEIARSNEDGFLIPTRYELKEIITGKAVDPVLKPSDRISIWR